MHENHHLTKTATTKKLYISLILDKFWVCPPKGTKFIEVAMFASRTATNKTFKNGSVLLTASSKSSPLINRHVV